MTELSPTAQAVLDAYMDEDRAGRSAVAATLRALADKVTPDNYESFTGYADWDSGLETRNELIREAILTIADELDAYND